jgi:polysaccharide export outer membrane protein
MPAVNYDVKIQVDDVLDINISSQNPEAAAPFNQQVLYGTMAGGVSGSADALKVKNYLVDKEGNIEFPVLGKIKADGMTKEEFTAMMQEKLKPFVSDAIVFMNISNFRIVWLGEISSGVVKVTGDRISFFEALAQVGDLRVLSKRKNILIFRDENGVKTFNRIDITQADFVNSPFYYLKQNDVVYVEPRRQKNDASALGPYLGNILQVLGFLITTTLILTRL